jgi:hypothetical protein
VWALDYREVYLNSYLVGEGMSGFVPAIAALIQVSFITPFGLRSFRLAVVWLTVLGLAAPLLAAVLRSQNYLFLLQLRLRFLISFGSGVGSDFQLVRRLFAQLYNYNEEFHDVLGLKVTCLILFKINYDTIYYLSSTRSQKPEPKLQIPAPALAPAKCFGSLRLRLCNTG